MILCHGRTRTATGPCTTRPSATSRRWWSCCRTRAPTWTRATNGARRRCTSPSTRATSASSRRSSSSDATRVFRYLAFAFRHSQYKKDRAANGNECSRPDETAWPTRILFMFRLDRRLGVSFFRRASPLHGQLSLDCPAIESGVGNRVPTGTCGFCRFDPSFFQGESDRCHVGRCAFFSMFITFFHRWNSMGSESTLWWKRSRLALIRWTVAWTGFTRRKWMNFWVLADSTELDQVRRMRVERIVLDAASRNPIRRLDRIRVPSSGSARNNWSVNGTGGSTRADQFPGFCRFAFSNESSVGSIISRASGSWSDLPTRLPVPLSSNEDRKFWEFLRWDMISFHDETLS